MSISYDLAVASSNRVALLFDDFPDHARDEFAAEIAAITAELASAVKGAEPTKTGQLRASTQSGVFVEQSRVTGRVSVTGPSGSQIFAKAAALEYGAQAPTKVKAYLASRSTVFGRAVAPQQMAISAYARTPDIAEHDFLRGPLGAMQSSILDRLNAALGRAAATGGGAP